MKKIVVLLIALFCFKNDVVFGQEMRSIDSVYYLLPENKNFDRNSIFKFELDEPIMYCILQCPCLENGEMPILSFNIDIKPKSYLTQIQLNEKFKLLSVPELIAKCKAAFIHEQNKKHLFFLVDKRDGKYLVYPAKLGQTHTVN